MSTALENVREAIRAVLRGDEEPEAFRAFVERCTRVAEAAGDLWMAGAVLVSTEDGLPGLQEDPEAWAAVEAWLHARQIRLSMGFVSTGLVVFEDDPEKVFPWEHANDDAEAL